jgi:hypothetical protein
MPSDVLKDARVYERPVKNKRGITMRLRFEEQHRNAFDIPQPVPLHWPVANDKKVRVPSDLEAKIPAEILLFRFAGRDALLSQFKDEMLRNVIAERVNGSKVRPHDCSVESI